MADLPDDAGAPPRDPSTAAEVVVEGSTPARRASRQGHTWPQRLLLALNILVILGCFATAAGLLIGRHYGNTLAKVELPDISIGSTIAGGGDPGTTASSVPGETAPPGALTTVPAPDETFPPADPNAQNFLITGADNNSCIDPDSPYAKAFGDRSSMGERSDTVMVMRVDPSTKRAAILSFPRDLWVKIAGRGNKSRINSAYVRDDPSRLIATIAENFGVPIDHFIQIDFCAFKTIVDAVDGGVGVPFIFPARDTHTGLYVPTPGCYYFDGDSALAYVRSRYYQFYNENTGKWISDPRSDLSRISRQQDFIRRVLDAALNQGLLSPSIISGLIEAAQKNVVVDQALTISKELEFVGVLRDIEPGAIATYQVETRGTVVGGASVLLPKLDGANMQHILRIFRGQAPLADAPEQVFESTSTSSTEPAATTAAEPGTTSRGSTSTPTSAGSTTTSSTTTTTTTLPGATTTAAPPTENIAGIVPPRDQTCP